MAVNDRSKPLALVRAQCRADTRLSAVGRTPAAVEGSFEEHAACSIERHRTRTRHWIATGAFWGGAWGLLGGPTLFYTATGTGVGADVKQALASLICGAAGTLTGAACAAASAWLTRHRRPATHLRHFTSNRLRLVDIDEAREYGLYDDHRPGIAMHDERRQ
jgi:hypothetical protein